MAQEIPPPDGGTVIVEKKTLGAKLKGVLETPSTRLLIVFSVIFLCGGGYVFYQNTHAKIVGSNLEAAPSVNSTPGGKEQRDNPYYQKTLVQSDNAHLAEAEKKGGSAMPTIGTGMTETKDDVVPAAKPSSALPAEPAEARTQKATTKETEEEKKRRKDAVSAKVSAAQELLKHWQSNPAEIVLVASTDKLASSTATSSDGNSSTSTQVLGKLITRMGTMAYGRNVLAINSDVPGTPAMVTVEGELLKGATLTGSVTKTDDSFVIRLTKMAWNNKDYKVDAIVIDPDTNAANIADKVDPRYLSRYGLLLGAKFLSGFATAASTISQTVTSSLTSTTVASPKATTEQALMGGVAQFGQQLSTDVAESAPKGKLIQMVANSGVGILFLETLREQDQNQVNATEGVKSTIAAASQGQQAIQNGVTTPATTVRTIP